MFAYNSASGSTVFVFSDKAIPTDKYIEVPSDFVRQEGYQYHIDWQAKTLVGEVIPTPTKSIDVIKQLQEENESLRVEMDATSSALLAYIKIVEGRIS